MERFRLLGFLIRTFHSVRVHHSRLGFPIVAFFSLLPPIFAVPLLSSFLLTPSSSFVFSPAVRKLEHLHDLEFPLERLANVHGGIAHTHSPSDDGQTQRSRTYLDRSVSPRAPLAAQKLINQNLMNKSSH